MKAARAAFLDSSWSDIAPAARGQLLYNLAELIDKHSEQLATLETWNMGKPYSVAKEEDVAEAVGTLK